jgi:hypothetical protein
MNTQYPIDDKSQVLNHQDNIGVLYRASGNLFICKQVSKTVPHSFVNSRSVIREFSVGSAIRMRRYLRECRADYRYMVTLTYPCGFESDGIISKNHLRRFMQEIQRNFKRDHSSISRAVDTAPQRLSLFWFLEFQERGAPHYHILSTHRLDKDWVSKRWYEIVDSEDIRHLHAGTRCEKLCSGRAGTVKYATKYASKQEQKVIPVGYENAGRFWGVYGDRWCVAADTMVTRIDCALGKHARVIGNLNRAVKHLINTGNMVVYKREQGVMIGIIESTHWQCYMRMKIGAVSTALKRHCDVFIGAEVMQDENYCDDKML